MSYFTFFSHELFHDFLEVRLQGGPSVYEGFLEIFWKNEWSKPCNFDNFAINEANVVCRSLSFGKLVNLSRKAFNNTGKKWLNKVSCKGDENSLLTCNIKDAGQPNCSAQDYIYMKCGLKGKTYNRL